MPHDFSNDDVPRAGNVLVQVQSHLTALDAEEADRATDDDILILNHLHAAALAARRMGYGEDVVLTALRSFLHAPSRSF